MQNDKFTAKITVNVTTVCCNMTLITAQFCECIYSPLATSHRKKNPFNTGLTRLFS